MELNQILNQRRSIRQFKELPVVKDDIIEILKAGIKAPSAGNLQPWRFIITSNQKQIDKAVDTTYLGADMEGERNQDWIRKAKFLIIACIDYKDTVKKYGPDHKKSAIQDVAAAVENMVLKTVDLGLATCWISGFRENELKDVFDVPNNVEILAFLPIGYNDDYQSDPSKKDLSSVLFEDCYGKKASLDETEL